jgi:hypothetical protein
MSPDHEHKPPSDAPVAGPSTASGASTGARLAALRRAVIALGETYESPTAELDGAEHWPRDASPSGLEEARERLARTGERRVWMARDAAERAVAREVQGYTRLLRDAGMRPRQVAAAVVAAVRAAAAPSLGDAALADAVHAAGRCSVEAYFER